MPILITCHCGKTLRAREDQAGRSCRCPACGSVLRVPFPVAKAAPPPDEPQFVEEQPEPPQLPQTPLDQLKHAVQKRKTQEQPAANQPDSAVVVPSFQRRGWRTIGVPESTSVEPEHLPPPESIAQVERSWRGKLYWLLLLFGLPLLYLTIITQPDLKQQLQKTLDANPQLRERFSFEGERLTDKSVEEFLSALPGHRILGAFLSHDTWAHWGMAVIATAVFFGIIAASIPGEDVTPTELMLSGLFTATLGVSILLLFQAFHLCFCLVSIWYYAALSPDAPFGASLLGFVLGIGVAEEITKCIPVLWRIHRDNSTGWREACLIGMASGAGFGISEGIHYSVSFYNGLEPASVYLMRFTSDVALHVMLSGAAGIMIWRKQKFLSDFLDPYDWVLNMTAIMIGPILLHGLFDALATRQWDAAAMAVWVGSFGFLAWQIGKARRREIDAAKPRVAGAKIVRTEKGTRFLGDVNS